MLAALTSGLIAEWIQLLLRWLHVVVGIAWIGASFYFVWLDNHLEKPREPELLRKGVDGELWAVHGGGFYNPQKYMLAPPGLPERLHWFYWESYATWLSGFALFVAVYLLNAQTYLIDPRVHDWPVWLAVSCALAFVLLGWVVYDALCRLIGTGRDPADEAFRERLLGGAVSILVAAAAWLTCELFAGRAAYLIVGAMLATIMSANVLMVIIPGQRKVIAAMRAGASPDPIHGKRGKQRSVHNTYFTLPVLFAMLSNHWAMLYQHPLNGLLLILMMILGATIRYWFVARHRGNARPWPWLASSAMLLAGIVVALPATRDPLPQAGAVELPSEVRQVVELRCVACHRAGAASKNIRLDEPTLVISQRDAIYQQVVITRQMPFNNATGISDEERALIGRWFAEAGQPRQAR